MGQGAEPGPDRGPGHTAAISPRSLSTVRLQIHQPPDLLPLAPRLLLLPLPLRLPRCLDSEDPS